MSLDEAIAGLGNGTVRFLPVNPARRVWDKQQQMLVIISGI